MVERQVLIVEDDQATRTLLETILRRSGLASVPASDGGRAIALLKERSFDLIILDLMMPHVGGFDVLDYVAGLEQKPPVIVCTAAGPAMTKKLPQDLVSAVLRKPFDIVELMESVTRLAGAAPARMNLPRVLIVDDESDARYRIRALAGPAEVLEAETAEDAMRLVREHRPDVILLDLLLPGMSGEEMLQQLRRDDATSSIPVVVVTGRRLSEDDRRSLDQYCSAVIYKGDLTAERMRDALRVMLKS